VINSDQANLQLLTHPAETALIRQLLRLEETVEIVAGYLAPHHLTHYAQELATAFHKFYHDCQVVGEDHHLSAARLSLVMAARIALANTLHLLGVAAPDQM
jgi:arginyl-tRNA synthetase